VDGPTFKHARPQSAALDQGLQHWLADQLLQVLAGRTILDAFEHHFADTEPVAEEMRTFLAKLDRICAKGIDVIITAHCATEKTNNPDGPDYDSWKLVVDKRIAQLKEEIGLNYLMCAPLSRDSFRLLAEKVVPRLVA
jgi:RecA-family ATPase